MSAWTIPNEPWTKQSFRNKSVACLKWICQQKNIDISDRTIYKKGVKPYKKALVAWHQAQQQPLEDQSDPSENAPHRMCSAPLFFA